MTSPHLTPRDLAFLSHLTGDPKSTAELMRAESTTNPNVNRYMRRLELLGLATCVRKGAKGRYPGLWVRTGEKPTGKPVDQDRTARARSPKFNVPTRFAAKVTSGPVQLRVVRVDRDGVAREIERSELARPVVIAPKGTAPPAPDWMRRPLRPPTARSFIPEAAE